MNTHTKIPASEADSETTQRIGLELEFSGLSEKDAAMTLATLTGGSAEQASADRWTCETNLFGCCEVYLDTKYAARAREIGGEDATALLRKVVPVELVTDPFPTPNLLAFDAVVDALRKAGAKGSRDGVLLGFGLHLNIEVPQMDAAEISRRLAAFALLEDQLRAEDPIDLSRRLLPFVRPYPGDLVDALAQSLPDDSGALIKLYLDHVPSRDHGLDLLPILATFDEARVLASAQEPDAIKSRPAYHFRLPDCRLDEQGWSVMSAWAQWQLVEDVAQDTAFLDDLRKARLAWTAAPVFERGSWADQVGALLEGRQEKDVS
jgi:hypothetical protein